MIRKILYVDDDVESRIIVADYLRNLGHEVVTVEAAADALSAARENALSAMILDVNLIGVDGPELMKLLRREHPGVPVILYSGMNQNDKKVKQMLAGGADRFLSKNEPLEALVKAVHSVVN
jgi:CheY-like chemotaxis protein